MYTVEGREADIRKKMICVGNTVLFVLVAQWTCLPMDQYMEICWMFEDQIMQDPVLEIQAIQLLSMNIITNAFQFSLHGFTSLIPL